MFPIPGDGKYLRQPLYARDMARIIIAAMEKRPDGGHFNIVGKDEVYYIDIIREIKKSDGVTYCYFVYPILAV